MKEGLSVAITKLVLVSLLSLFGFFLVFFLFLGIAAILNNLLQSHFWGYLIIAAFFAVGLFIVLSLREKIALRIRKEVTEEIEGVEEEVQNS